MFRGTLRACTGCPDSMRRSARRFRSERRSVLIRTSSDASITLILGVFQLPLPCNGSCSSTSSDTVTSILPSVVYGIVRMAPNRAYRPVER
eukprot:2788780-Rhodomonas_salina.1